MKLNDIIALIEEKYARLETGKNDVVLEVHEDEIADQCYPLIKQLAGSSGKYKAVRIIDGDEAAEEIVGPELAEAHEDDLLELRFIVPTDSKQFKQYALILTSEDTQETGMGFEAELEQIAEKVFDPVVHDTRYAGGAAALYAAVLRHKFGLKELSDEQLEKAVNDFIDQHLEWHENNRHDFKFHHRIIDIISMAWKIKLRASQGREEKKNDAGTEESTQKDT